MAASLAPAAITDSCRRLGQAVVAFARRAKALAGTTQVCRPSHPDSKMGWVTGRHPVRVIVNTGPNLSARLLAATKFLVPVLPGGYVPVSASACGARRGRGAAADGRGRRARSGQERHPPVLAARPPRVGDAYWQGMPASRRPPCVTSGAHSGRLVTLSHRHTVRYVISSLDAASRVRAAVRFPSPGSWRSRSTAASRRSASARGTRHPRTARDTVEHSADALHHLRSGRALHGAQRR
jgi:hypothetical protein